jgi:hypothetical protein
MKIDLKDVLNKAAKLKDSKQFNDLLDKAVENMTAPKTTKQHVRDAAIGVAFGLATGGAIIPIIALAAAEEIAVKTLSHNAAVKKAVEARRNRKQNNPKDDGPKPQ